MTRFIIKELKKMANIDYHHFPGIMGPMGKKSGNKMNLLRWIISVLIKLNNKIEKWKR